MYTVLSDDNQALYHATTEPASGNYVHGKRTIGMFWDGSRMVPKLPSVETERKARMARSHRNRLLAQSDWTQVSDAPVDQAAWATYRQALRDVPQQAGFPHDVTWPIAPT